MPPRCIGIIAHTEKPAGPVVLKKLYTGLMARGVAPLLDSDTARLLENVSGADLHRLRDECDLLLVLGGDGTLLRLVHELGGGLPPLLGVNIGSLGFLTTAQSETVDATLDAVLGGEMDLSHRTLLGIAIRRHEGGHQEFRDHQPHVALNDCVIGRGVSPNLVRLKVSVNDGALTEYNADGVIIASPTGSTAYSLSAGGPIVAPDAAVFVITPICPHVLTNRSVIVPDTSRIRITVAESREVLLSVDGRPPICLAGGDGIEITRAAEQVALASLRGLTFFDVLRDKLRWGGSNV